MDTKKMTVLVAMAAAMAGCGGMEGTGGGDPTGSQELALASPVSAPQFWMAVYETEVGRNPFFNRSECVMGREQERPILAGGFVMSLDHHFPGQVGVARRVCAVEAGKVMLMPLVTVSMDGAGLEAPPPERVLKARVGQVVSAVKGLRLEIDGRDARSMDLPFVRTGQQVYGYAMPAVGALYPLPEGQQDVAPAVADGIFVELPALTPGRHRLLIEGVAGGRPFRIEYALDAN